MMKLVGILNMTPDSFSDGGQFVALNNALAQAHQLFSDGATIVDVGAESTRPGARAVEPAEEWKRQAAFWESVRASDNLDMAHFSLDTRHAEVAQKFLSLGGNIINDVSGFQDPEMVAVVAQHKAQAWVNHFPGKTVDEVHEQKICSINQVADELQAKAEQMMRAGIARERIVLDPGIGFGKTMELNWALLEFAALVPEWPVLIGASKKRFLGEHRSEKEPNVKAAALAEKAGAQYLRVHNPEWYGQ